MVPVFRERTVQLVSACKKKKIPVIFFDSTFPDLDNLAFIGQDAEDSGYIAADLFSRCTAESAALLIVTIKEKDDNHLQFAKREEGLKRFFEGKKKKLITYENSAFDDAGIKGELESLLKKNPSVGGIFVTNGVAKVASVIESLHSKKKYRLLGYDLIEENVIYLKRGTIDFLICQQPHMQSYQGIKYFYDYLILKHKINKEHFLPITIVMESTLKYQTFSP
jgi:LacI family transcriptional regulator